MAKQFDPSAEVKVGEWVKGPDGLREVDVLITGTVDGVTRQILIDAADSKRRDLAADVTLICSNAGFSKDAMRKAGRVGIGLIGVMREPDPRIRYKVFDEKRFPVILERFSLDIVPIFIVRGPPPSFDDALKSLVISD